MANYLGSVLEVTNTYPAAVILALDGFDYRIDWPVGIPTPPVASRVTASFNGRICTKVKITNSSDLSWVGSEITWTGGKA